MSNDQPDLTGQTAPVSDDRNLYRQLPSVQAVLDSPALAGWREQAPAGVIADAVRTVLEAFRTRLADGAERSVPDIDAFAAQTAALLAASERPRLRPVINATGILLHTGLGRAPLAEAAVTALADAGRGYTPLELDLESGERGKRVDVVRDLLCQLTGAESATVVNNNAAATLIVLATVAPGRRVIVSRGELIEIGGSFRLPEIMETSGAVLHEVGTTNKTRLTDYEQAIGDDTGALLKVHTSNYRLVGFTESVPLSELVALGRRHGLAVIDDIGSGALVDFAQLGLADEPVVARAAASGADLVLFSGDKLLGGPQCGIIVGRRQWIELIEQNPLMRALRVGKLTLAALEATLRLYRDPQRAWAEIPTLALAAAPLEALDQRAARLAEALHAAPGIAQAQVVRSAAYLGGGSLPTQQLPSAAVHLRHVSLSETELARRLRTGQPPVIPRVQAGAVLLDFRSVFPGQDEMLVKVVRHAAKQTHSKQVESGENIS